MKRLEGKVALISGTSRGQGRAAALRFAAEGALVVGGDLPHEEAAETRRLIAREGGTALGPAPLDVTDEASVRSWGAGAVDAFGGADIVCANAGLTGALTNRRTAHSASKGGVIALTRQPAAEGAPFGIRANCVGLGRIDTDGSRAGLLADDHPLRGIARPIPLGRTGTPDDVVDAR
ncbi:SDR family NAD(P)-dependent oxidoreductase [Streptomyces olivaceoviridis]|uniref:SDR family NAD(P)-dependent oxidoreductase n=1 Tax=Streptomyces olivaceoviridis TaxID=1921 RepID=UPI00369BFC43